MHFRSSFPLLLWWSLLALAGCDDLREFKTGAATVFRGEVAGSDSDPERSSFIRTGFPSHTQLELSFDPYASGVAADEDSAGSSAAGRVHSYVCPDAQRECAPADASVGPFDRAPLELIDSLAHDALSEYTFPGGGRLRNYMFGARFETVQDGSSVPRSAMIFVSLMDSGKIELRAVAPSVLAADRKSELLPPLFGVFVLERQPR